ncbi:MAG: SGNH/GDSL hydrolase family protein, partial [Sulfitobacter sp.]
MTKIIALRTRLFLMLFAGLVLTACTDAAPKNGGDILVLGDSVMAWNGSDDQSIGDVIGKVLNRQVVDKSVPGAKFSNDSPLFSAIGFDIRQQYPGGRWNWVVMDGGA